MLRRYALRIDNDVTHLTRAYEELATTEKVVAADASIQSL
jgi:hypothetical protein